MSRFLKFILVGCLILSASVFGVVPAEQAANASETASSGYTREEIKTALRDYERTGTANEIAKAVLLPASMGITLPNLNPAKVQNETPLSAYGNREDFYAALRTHGYDDPDMKNMPYWKYEKLEADWLLEPELAALLVATNPELADRDLSQWTYGDYTRFNEQKNAENLAARFTPEQQAKLEARGIRMEDLRPLMKTFFDAETILAQSDETLRSLIEDWYETKLTLSLGADWRLSARVA